MSRVKTVYPPTRPVRKILVTLPKDIVEMLDNCSKAIGMSRSAFLQVYFDGYNEQVVNFTRGWLRALLYYGEGKDAEKLGNVQNRRG